MFLYEDLMAHASDPLQTYMDGNTAVNQVFFHTDQN